MLTPRLAPLTVVFAAAAAERVAGGRDILESAGNGDCILVLCHVIADADCVNKRDRG